MVEWLDMTKMATYLDLLAQRKTSPSQACPEKKEVGNLKQKWSSSNLPPM